jgi:hypothetical protein
VGDRGSDIYTFWQTCSQLGYDFVIRLAQDRRVRLDEGQDTEDPEVQRLKVLARSLDAPLGSAFTGSCPASAPRAFGVCADQLAKSPYPAAHAWGEVGPNGDHGLGGSRLGTLTTASRGAVGVAPGHDGPSAMHSGCLGTSEMVQMALDFGGLPQGSQDWLWHGGPSSPNGRGSVEAIRGSDADGDALVMVTTDRPVCA